MAALVVAVADGCKRRPDPPVKFIPGKSRTITNELAVLPPDGWDTTTKVSGKGPVTSEVVPKVGGESPPLSPRELIENMIPDREIFKNQTVYFGFDRATIKASEGSKLKDVAKVLKEKDQTKVQIEGHCDERGTEEYNRSLGERRALALREYLINLGVTADRVFTISYGEDKPAVPEHTDAAWEKNRRGEFILLSPKN